MIAILKNIVFVNLSISQWTARKKLKIEDLKRVDGSQIPPDRLASLGSKRVMKPEALAPFAAFKRQAERVVLAAGTRFLGGYAIPDSKINDVMAKLDDIKTNFIKAKAAFLLEYDTEVAAWIDDNPGWENVIRQSIESISYVERQLQFSVQTINLSPVKSHTSGLQQEVNSLAGQLRHETQVAARQSWDASFKGNAEVGQKAVRPIRALLEKIEGLVFLEPELAELVAGIKNVLDALPKHGAIKGADFAALCGVMQLLGDIPDTELMVGAEEEDEVEDAQTDSDVAVPFIPIPAIGTPVEMPVEWF